MQLYLRIAHALYEQGYRVHARVMSEIGHSQTGIDIHPGAKFLILSLLIMELGLSSGKPPPSDKELKYTKV